MKKVAVVALVLIGLVFAGCEKMEMNVVEQNEKNTEITEDFLSKVTLDNGVLCFENFDVFNKATKQILFMSEDEYYTWAEKNNFKSLQMILDEVMEAENNLTEYYETLTDSEAAKITILDNAELTTEYAKQGYINLSKEGFVSLNTNTPEIARILTNNNLVCISDTIYQFNVDNIKKIPNKNFSMIPELEKTFQTTSDNSIIVENPKYSQVNRYWTNSNVPGYEHHSVMLTGDGKKRALYSVCFRQISENYPIYYSYFYISIEYQKYVFGKWRPRNTDFQIFQKPYEIASTPVGGNETVTNGEIMPATYWNKSVITHIIFWGEYGGNLNNYTHTHHIKSGRYEFKVSNVGQGDFVLWRQYGLK